MRLDRYLARATGLTRSQARQALKRGRVEVAGVVARSAAVAVDETETVTLDGERLSLPGPVYLMLNKPEGVVCATRDGEHRTVIDLLPEEIRARAQGTLHPAGRLDIDTTGLVLITDDGQWSHAVTSPRRQCRKCYRVTLADPLNGNVAERFAEGVMLNGETQATRPAQLCIDSPREVSLTISEGRYHQVKRMFAAVGNRVTALHRQRIGSVELDPTLAPGDWRPLTDSEISSFTDTGRNPAETP